MGGGSVRRGRTRGCPSSYGVTAGGEWKGTLSDTLELSKTPSDPREARLLEF